MLGLGDFSVSLAFILCLLSSLVCVVYGAVNWNKGEEPPAPDDEAWAKAEEEFEEEF